MKSHHGATHHAAISGSVWSVLILCLLSSGLWTTATAQSAWDKQKEVWRQDASFHPEIPEQDRQSLIRDLEPWPSGKPIRRADTLPASHINHLHLPTVRSQGSQPSCYSWAFCYYYRTWQEAREHGWIHPDPSVNPEQVMYHEFEYRLGGVTDVLKILGCASYKAMEDGWDEEQNLPTEACFDDARLHRAQSFYTLPADATQAMAALKQHLADGDLAYVGISAANNFSYYHGGTGTGYDNDVFYAYEAPYGAGHALTVLGYDDTKAYTANGEAKQGAFILVNSWGQSWGCTLAEIGTPGFIWIGYDFFIANMLNSIVLMEDRPSVDDKNFAYVRLEHGRIPELNWKLIGGSPQFPTATYNLGSLFGLGKRDALFKFGIDELVGGVSGGGAVRMRVYDMDLSGGMLEGNYTGTIKAFWVDMDGVSSDWIAEQNLPATTVDVQSLTDADEIAEKSLIWDLRAVEENYVESFDWTVILQKQLRCADFDGDGDMDLLGRPFWQLQVGDGQGNFTMNELDINRDLEIEDVADFNNDGLLDLLLKDEENSKFVIYYGTATAERFVDSGVSFENDRAPLHASVVDYNRDGRVDICIHVAIDYDNISAPTGFRLWLNGGDGTFTESDLRLSYVDDYYDGSMSSWCDYDNDGLPDLAFYAGEYFSNQWNEWTQSRLYILHNNGNGTFTEVDVHAFYDISQMRWADIDGDGLLDLIMSEYYGLIILRNTGSGQFEEMTHDLQGFSDVVSFDLGDADNDGLTDIALQCKREEEDGTGVVYEKDHTGLFFNRGNGKFIWATGPTQELYHDTAVALGDFDADGDLDMCAYGNYYEDNRIFRTRMEFFENKVANERLERPNAAPEAPVITWAGYDPDHKAVTFQWRVPQDDHTVSSRLGWRVRLGTRPGRGDLIGAAFTSERPVQVHPSPDSNGLCLLTVYAELTQAAYLSLQAVDEGLASSDWSAAYELLPSGATSIYDVNEDGSADVADLVRVQNILSGSAQASQTPRADLSGDGNVTLIDRTMMLDYLIAKLSVEATTIDLIPVGPEAATVKYDGLEMDFPAGMNNQEYTVMLTPASADAPYANMISGSFYCLDGMPAGRNAAVTVRMYAPGADPQTTRLLFGQVVTPTSIWEPIQSWLAIAPDSSDGDWLTFTIPASGQTTTLSKSAATKDTSDASVRRAAYSLEPLTNWIGLATGIIRMESDHFYVDYPQEVDTANISVMVDALEWAYTNLKDVYGFNFTDFPNWPAKVPINVINLHGGTINSIKQYLTGEEVPVEYGYFDPIMGYIAINQKDITGSAANATHVLTAVHEFSHMVIRRFRPLLVSQDGFEYNVDWVDEATAVWFESVYNNWVAPAVLNEHMTKPFRWGMLGNGASTDPDVYGYGMASLISYFTDVQVNDQFPRQLWGNLQGGKSTLASIRAASGEWGNDWWNGFMQSLITSNIYPFGWQDVEDAVGSNIIDMADFSTTDLDYSRSKSFATAQIEDLSSRLMQFKLDGLKITPKTVLSMRLEPSGSQMDLTAIRFEKPAAIELKAEGTQAGDLIKLDLPLSGLNGSNETSILPLITVPDDHLGSYCTGTDFRYVGSSSCHPHHGTALLKVALTQDRTWDLPTPNIARNGHYGLFYIESVVSVKGPGLADVEFIDVSPDAGQVLYATSMGVPPIEFTINVSSSFQTTQYVSGSITYTAGPVKFYRLRYKPESSDDADQIFDSTDGVLKLPQSVTSRYLLGSIKAVYDITRTQAEETETIADHETLVSSVLLLP